MIPLRISSRILLGLCAIALLAVLVFPIWRIELDAPQYPEGLLLLIYANKLGGGVEIINGLNHYIGMKTLHENEFIEFSILPKIIIFFSAAFLLVSIFGKKKWLSIVLVLFILFGIVAMIDFWRWEYDYGHNLDPDAAIKIPGMAYQPPLIGFKQLLNFGAFSVPDIGGWIFIGVGLIALLLFLIENNWFPFNKFNKGKGAILKKNNAINATATLVLISFFMQACSHKPTPIRVGKDLCTHCKMLITDDRFGAVMVNQNGKSFVFDDLVCVKDYIKAQTMKIDANHFYLVNFNSDHQLIDANTAFLMKSEQFNSPMGGNVAAFDASDSLSSIKKQFNAAELNWKELIQ